MSDDASGDSSISYDDVVSEALAERDLDDEIAALSGILSENLLGDRKALIEKQMQLGGFEGSVSSASDIHDIELSLTLAGLMKKMPEGTCPLVCSVREVKVENRCELKTCPSGQYLDSRGTCRVRQARASKPRASGGGGGGGGGGRNCVTYNARTYCN